MNRCHDEGGVIDTPSCCFYSIVVMFIRGRNEVVFVASEEEGRVYSKTIDLTRWLVVGGGSIASEHRQ